MQENISFPLSKPWWNPVTRWLTLAGVVGPILFVGVFTLAGFLRPGYSPIHQAVSDLGVGSNAWLLDGSLIINGLLLIGFAVGFALSMRQVLSQGWRWSSAVLLALHGLGIAIAGVFTEAPSTLAIHWKVGAPLAFFGPIVAFLVVGLVLCRDARWRGWGISLLGACLLTLVLIITTFWVFTPGSTLASLRLGGLLERMSFIEIEAWYVIMGWRLLRLARSPKPGSSHKGQQHELEQPYMRERLSKAGQASKNEEERP